MTYEDLKPCPRCGSKNLSCYAFSLSEDAGIYCKDCGFVIEREISWDGCEPDVPETDDDYDQKFTEKHDVKAYEVLKEIWNNTSIEEVKASN